MYKVNKDAVQLLLDNSKRNIDLNASSDKGRTTFNYACENGHTDAVKLLVEDNLESNIDF